MLPTSFGYESLELPAFVELCNESPFSEWLILLGCRSSDRVRLVQHYCKHKSSGYQSHSESLTVRMQAMIPLTLTEYSGKTHKKLEPNVPLSLAR